MRGVLKIIGIVLGALLVVAVLVAAVVWLSGGMETAALASAIRLPAVGVIRPTAIVQAVVKETVVVEKRVEVPKEVTKIVEKIVEVRVPVTVTVPYTVTQVVTSVQSVPAVATAPVTAVTSVASGASWRTRYCPTPEAINWSSIAVRRAGCSGWRAPISCSRQSA